MTILIAFATIEGQTGKIARFVEAQLKAAGHPTKLLDTSEVSASAKVRDADRVILAAPVHERRHPKGFEMFVKAKHDVLSERPTMMLSVSLSAAFPEGMEDAQDYLTEMEMRTGFKPTQELLVAGAIRAGAYDYYASQVLRHVILRGRNVDPAQGAHEFTNWDELKRQVLEFAGAAVDAA